VVLALVLDWALARFVLVGWASTCISCARVFAQSETGGKLGVKSAR
jgi:hypothetical protein